MIRPLTVFYVWPTTLGLSLLNTDFEELLYASAFGIDVSLHLSGRRKRATVAILGIQVDNQTPSGTRQPVVFGRWWPVASSKWLIGPTPQDNCTL